MPLAQPEESSPNDARSVLVVEDEHQIADLIAQGLRAAGFTVTASADGNDALAQVRRATFDAIVLDIMLPGIDGIAVLRGLRGAGIQTPVILLTARDALADRVGGLQAGADDYLTKPFYVEELVARLHALIRRSEGRPASLLTYAGLSLNRLTRDVLFNDRKLDLTSREFQILEMLMRDPGTVITRAELFEQVWHYQSTPNTNILDVYIRRLRAKLGDFGADGLIETVRGFGYRIAGETIADT